MKTSVTQEHGTGCAVACVAFVTGRSYRRALALFAKPERAWGRGFYCRDLVAALARAKRAYNSTAAVSRKRWPAGTIVYVAPSRGYPLGHYLASSPRGWMNPWANFPCIAPARSAFQKKLPGRPIYAVFPLKEE